MRAHRPSWRRGSARQSRSAALRSGLTQPARPVTAERVAHIRGAAIRPVLLERLSKLPILFVVGDADVDEGTNDKSLAWIPGGWDARETAMERLRSFEKSLNANGIQV